MQILRSSFADSIAAMRLDRAQARIAETYDVKVGTETVALAIAVSRVLAEDVTAPISLPAADNSAIDGFALRFDDLRVDGPSILPLHGRTPAGPSPDAALPPGCAGRIFTGAVLPSGADTVVMQEDCAVIDGKLHIPQGIFRGANRRLAGEDLSHGKLALPAGRRLMPPDLALLAALGFDSIAVRKRLRVAIFSTGNEIATPPHPLRRGQVYDANRALLCGLLQRLQIDVVDGGILPDEAEATKAALRTAAGNADLVITSGGVSAGEEDHVRAAIESIGRLEFWRVAIKPGHPVTLGVMDGTPLLGLPGNPVAAMVTFWAIGRPLLDRLAGATSVPSLRLSVQCGFHHLKKSGLREYVRVQIKPDGIAYVYPKKGTGILTSLTEGDALLELTEELTSIRAGDFAPCIPLLSLYG
ncbi:MAG TPA: gephyrin-like molybdotransferase Glp [Rhodopseudomonas sp.]|uniref:molybdopterin molybdotransferase MoeA n=1 Tax=Rhodopseudomonas sp. TaxID=1078 RepID=UPI002ED9A532